LFVVFFHIEIKFIIINCLVISFLVLLAEELAINFISVGSFETNDGTISQVLLSLGRKLAFRVSGGCSAGTLASSLHLIRLTGDHSKRSAIEGVSHARLAHVPRRNVSFYLTIFLHGARELSIIDE